MLEREEAIERLEALKGKNLHDVARKHGVTIFKNGKQNKGWVGHVCERELGLPINSSRNPNFGSWELKSTSLKYLKNGKITPKETIAICMIDPVFVKKVTFEESHLWAKLQKTVIVARTVGSNFMEPSFVYDVRGYDLESDELAQVKKDFYEIQDCLRDPKRGFDALTGRMGKLVQPRTKGPGGKAFKSRAFYARTQMVKAIFDL